MFCSFSVLFVAALMTVDGKLCIIQPLGHNLATAGLVCTIACDSLPLVLVHYVCQVCHHPAEPGRAVTPRNPSVTFQFVSSSELETVF